VRLQDKPRYNAKIIATSLTQVASRNHLKSVEQVNNVLVIRSSVLDLSTG
jgi:hypothetical protein